MLAATALVALASLPLKCVSLTPIYIGGFVNNFDIEANASQSGTEHLAAANLAIRNINNKTDGVFDSILPNHYFLTAYAVANDYVTAAQNAYSMDYTVFNKRGIDVAVIAGIDDAETSSILKFLEKKEIVAISTNDQSPDLSVGINYPFKLRVAPSESYSGHVLQSIIYSHMGIRHLGIFHNLDSVSTHAAREFLSRSIGVFDLLFNKELDEESIDYSVEIEEAKHMGAKVFVLFTHQVSSAYLLTQGYKMGLFSEDTIIFAHDEMLEVPSGGSLRSLMQKADSSVDVDSALKGIIGVYYYPQYKVESTAEGQSFMSRWREQEPTVMYDSTGKANCTYDRDSDGDFLLYRSSSSAPNSKCAGLDFSTYHQNASDIDTFTPLAYDAVVALALGLHHILHTQNLSEWGGSDLMTAMLNVSFKGATGAVSFDHGEHNSVSIYNDKYGLGDRKTGHAFELLNYQKATTTFVKVGLWDSEDDYQLCDEFLHTSLTSPGGGLLMPCDYYVVYNSKDGKRPTDRLPDIIHDTDIAVIASMALLGALSIIAVIFVSIVLITHREKKLTKASQPPMMAAILIGTTLAFARTIVGGLPNSTGKCIASLWTGHLSFVIVFGALSLKAWRVNKIVNSTSLRRVKISNKDVARFLAYLILCAVVYLILTSVIGAPHLSATEHVAMNRKTIELGCALTHPEFEDVLFGLEGLLLLWGARLCNATKNAPSAINESGPVANTIMTIVSVSIPVMCIIFLLYDSIGAIGVEVLGSIAFLIAGLTTIVLIFLPKVVVLLSGLDINLKISHTSKEEEEKQVYAADEVVTGDEAEKLLKVTAKGVLKGKDLDTKFAICQRQLNFWRAEVMMIEERRTSDGSTGTASRASIASSVAGAGDGKYSIMVEGDPIVE